MSYNYKGEKPTITCGPGRTKQSFSEKVNINSIIAKHRRTGMIEHLNKNKPFYGDVSEITTYKESLETVLIAQNLFSKMSADIRERFKNDPNEMITYLNDPKNIEEAIKLKMIKPKPLPPQPDETKPKALKTKASEKIIEQPKK